MNGVGRRKVLVTGGSRGLGREMALALAEAGAAVAITGARPSSALDETGEALERLAGPGRALAIAADAGDAEAAARAVAEAARAFGGLDMLVNNAGLGMRLVSETFTTEPTRFWETEPEAWRRIVMANVDGPFLMARAAVPLMLEAGGGRIVNVSTSAQTMVRRGYAPYGPSKAFLEAASRVWAADLAGTGIDVNVLLPGGATATDLLPPGSRGADGNLLDPAIMRPPILWLASEAAKGVTGARFVARLWREDDPMAAREDGAAAPRIM